MGNTQHSNTFEQLHSNNRTNTHEQIKVGCAHGPGGENDPGLSADETRSHFGSWAIVSSPLTLSHDVSKSSYCYCLDSSSLDASYSSIHFMYTPLHLFTRFICEFVHLYTRVFTHTYICVVFFQVNNDTITDAIWPVIANPEAIAINQVGRPYPSSSSSSSLPPPYFFPFRTEGRKKVAYCLRGGLFLTLFIVRIATF